MIISYSKKFIFLKTGKTGGTSLEMYLSQFCDKFDLITPILGNEEKLKKKYRLPSKQNFKLKKFSLGLRTLSKFSIYRERTIYDHSDISRVLKTSVKSRVKDYYVFAFIRNPYDWIVSDFWWNLFYHKRKGVNFINSLNRQQISKKFKKFLKNECEDFFRSNENIITSDKIKINVYKYGNFEKSIRIIKKKLNLKKEIISINEIKLKKLGIRRKIKIDRDDKEFILKSASYFFNSFKYSKKLPDKYK